jgi:thiosulfate/3-mercaptopyruvate sulfurtransferase
MSELLSTNGLISAQDLYYLLGGETPLRVLDATYASGAPSLFMQSHIEGAQYFDIDAVADQASPLPHMLPAPHYFEQAASALGLSNNDHIVIYDQSAGYMASSRAWWMFRAMGHNAVYVLDGGLSSWTGHGFKTISGPAAAVEPGTFKARFRPELVADKERLLANLDSKAFTVLDARPAARFTGAAPEPRPGMRGGHIPGSVNLPFALFLKPDGTFRDAGEIEAIFTEAGIAPGAPVAASCGSGVTACTVALALFAARGEDCAVYDASWSEWGQTSANTPVAASA